jgi:hypothetical protein
LKDSGELSKKNATNNQFYSDQNIDPLKLSRIDARLYLAFLMKYDNKASLMRNA